MISPVGEREIDDLLREVDGMDAQAILAWASDRFGTSVTIASSLGAEDQVLAHMVSRMERPIAIFTLDTGRMFNESYDLLERTRRELGVPIVPFFPDAAQVEEMVREEGVNLFYRSIELRKRCCGVRKVEPLRRALAGKLAWITGLRRSQSVTRAALAPVEWDAQNGLLKISPLASWSEDEVWGYIRAHRVPYNALHDRGFPSIGCAPCTRAVEPGADPRSGRWWWEQPEHRECGLHGRNGGDATDGASDTGVRDTGGAAPAAARLAAEGGHGTASAPRIQVRTLRLDGD